MFSGKVLYEAKSSGLQLSLQAILIAFDLAYNKNNLHETLDYWSRDILNFGFLEKGLGIVSPPHFVNDFSRKTFLMLHSINWSSFIVWLPLLLEILGNISAIPRGFFWHTGTCTGNGTSTEVLESGPSDRQTDRQNLWLYLAAFQYQTTKQSYKIIR